MHLHRKWRSLFYGWWIVAACFLVSMSSAGVVHFGFTAFFEPIAEEFGWSYTRVSLAASLRGLEMGILAPFVGLIMDRWGPRKLVATGAIFTAAGLFLLSRTMSLGMFYAAFVLLSFVSVSFH